MEKVVKDKDGNERTVIAGTQEELDEAVKAVENQAKPTYPNINVPRRKGHDLVEVQDDLSVKLVDGTGAHNSPRDAVRDDGSVEGTEDTPVPGMDEPALKTQGDPGNVRPLEDRVQGDRTPASESDVNTADDTRAEVKESSDTDSKEADRKTTTSDRKSTPSKQ